MQNSIVGVFCDEGTPVPIPNTVVKLIYADNTWLATAREDRSMPTYLTGTDFSSGFFLFVDTDCRILYNRENNACKGGIPVYFSEPELYDDEQRIAVEDHIETYFGEFDFVFHETVEQGIRVDVYVIEPNAERDFYTLVTVGMGAHEMNVPVEPEFRNKSRAELVLCVPSDWDMETGGWAVQLLMETAHFPVEENAWLEAGHSIEMDGPVDETAAFTGVILTSTYVQEREADSCVLPDGDTVCFYQVIPLFYEEIRTYSSTDLVDFAEQCLSYIGFIADPERENTCITVQQECSDIQKQVFASIEQCMDDAQWHYSKIEEKGLPLNEATGYQHLAIYLRWCMEHQLMSATFMQEYGDIADYVREQGSRPDNRLLLECDLRHFLREEFDGILHPAMFNPEGQAFAAWYYGEGQTEPYFPADIDLYACAYFGEERYHSEVFQDEDYLFLPWEEMYYQNMARLMDKRFRQWKAQK